MSEEKKMDENSSAVQAHLTIIQNVIQRMSSNSASAKAWCITLVSAILVLIADKARSEYALIALIPIVLFLALDTYYLALEKSFRISYNNFIDKLHRGSVQTTDLYSVIPEGKFACQVGLALISFSVWPFYIALLLMVCLSWKYIL